MKKIKLSQGKYAVVDDADFDLLNKHKWHLNSSGYAVRNIKTETKRTQIKMHRVILNTPYGMGTDHINNDRLDNRRINLRVCTQKENTRNRVLSTRRSSQYKGVTWYKITKKWRAQIGFNGKKYNLGYFSDELSAASKYNEYASLYFGQFAKINNLTK